MTSRKYGLPPQYPQMGRRGSNTPISPMAINQSQLTPNRSRSLDGLLDAAEPTVTAKTATTGSETTPSDTVQITQSSEEIPEAKPEEEAVNEDKAEPSIETETETMNNKNSNLSKAKAQSMDNNLDVSNETGDINKSSMLSLHSNSSDSKRKRNFMDRCVNKVRSLIKK